MSDSKPIQCPNCGGYKVEDGGSKGCIDLILIIVTGGLWIIVMFLRSKTVKDGDELQCSICGYSWTWRY